LADIIPSLLSPLFLLRYHPLSLKKAYRIVLPEPNKKDYKSSALFLVIVFLQTNYKIIECIAASSLATHARSFGLNNPNQSGSLAGV
jgi:hypothetical protein